MLMALSPVTAVPPPTKPRNRSRGRSRKVSRTALARQASIEKQSMNSRGHCMIRATPPQPSALPQSPSPSPPPSPNPADLADQIFIAYAHDNFHLAKKLLLQLKGIKISGDDDPLIDSVRDEDFDYCFMPNGRVMLDTVPRVIDPVVRQREERQRAEEERKRRKAERLRRCEIMWEERERLSLHEDDRWIKHRSCNHHLHHHKRGRSLISLTLSTVSWDDNGDASIHRSTTPPLSPAHLTYSRPSDMPKVTFKDVLASMDGHLFPLDTMEQRHYHTHTRSASRSSPENRKRQLFQSLLQPADCDKDKIRPFKRPSRLNVRSSVSTTSSSSTSSSALSRASSWISFRTNTASSVSTAGTSPAASPKAPFLSFRWTKSRSPEPLSRGVPHLKKEAPLIPVPFQDTPLFYEENTHRRHFSKYKGRGGDDGVDMGGTSNNKKGNMLRSDSALQLVKQVKKLIGIATAFQTAYMAVASYSVALEAANISPDSLQGVYGGGRLGYGYHGAGLSAIRRPTPNLWDELYQPPKKRKLNCGGRVKRSDVIAFLPTREEIAVLFEEPKYHPQAIPLLPPPTHVPHHKSSLSSSSSSTRSRSSAFQQRPAVFQSPAPPTRSPLRARHLPPRNLCNPGMISPPSPLSPRCHPPIWRLRPISNPVALRLRALANVLEERGCNWQGRGDPGMLGGAQERILGIAIEGCGRTLLGL